MDTAAVEWLSDSFCGAEEEADADAFKRLPQQKQTM